MAGGRRLLAARAPTRLGASAEEEEEGAAGDGAASEAKEEAPKPQVVRDAERNRTLLGEGPFLVAHMEVAVLECRRGRERLGGAMVEEGKEILDGLDGAHPRVHAAFYAGRAEFFRVSAIGGTWCMSVCVCSGEEGVCA